MTDDQHKLIYGFGIYDSDEPKSTTKNGKTQYNQIYYRWRAMIQRCYDSRSIKTAGKSEVCEEWAYYSNFKNWVVTQQDWETMCLDKDILSGDRKIYSPETCAFVPVYINSLLNSRSNDRGVLPLGVSYRPKCPTMINEFRKCYIAHLSKEGKQKAVKFSETIEEAHAAWQWAKSVYIEECVTRYSRENAFNTLIADKLLAKCWNLRLDFALGHETKAL